MDDEFLNDYRKAAEVHRQVRQHVQTIVKPGITLSQLANQIEDGVRSLVGASAKALLKLIDENFDTLVFSRRYLERLGAKNYHLGMKSLVANGIVYQYAPSVEIPGSYVAQLEHVSLLLWDLRAVLTIS